MTSSNTAAVEAARVALAIAINHETSQPVVLRSSAYTDALGAAQAALTAGQYPGINYVQTTIQASYGIHGAHLEDDARIEAKDNHLFTVIVVIDVQHPISNLTLIPVLSSLAREIELTAEDAQAYVATIIYILNEPAPSEKAV